MNVFATETCPYKNNRIAPPLPNLYNVYLASTAIEVLNLTLTYTHSSNQCLYKELMQCNGPDQDKVSIETG